MAREASVKGERVHTVKNRKTYYDFNLMFLTLFLCVFGLIMIYSAAAYTNEGSKYFFIRQSVFIIIAVGLTAFISRFPFSFWKKVCFPLLGVSLLLLFMVKTPLGYSSHGASRWISLGGITVQPAEVVKISIIFYSAYVLDKCKDKMNNYKVALMIGVPAVFMSLLIYVLTNNLSSMIIVVCIAFIMYFALHPNWKWFVVIALIGLSLLMVVILYVESINIDSLDLDKVENFRFLRILAWRHPEKFMSDTAMQTLNALYAIGSGGLFGKGLGASAQKAVIPEVENDMIFSVVCEELGLFGAFVLILLYILLLYRIIFVAKNTSNTFASILSIGVFAHISIQVILNIAVVTNVIPNTGVTLPFISYGGSAVAILIFEVGMVLKASRYIPTKPLADG